MNFIKFYVSLRDTNLPANYQFAANPTMSGATDGQQAFPVNPADIHYYRMTTQFGSSPSQLFYPEFSLLKPRFVALRSLTVHISP